MRLPEAIGALIDPDRLAIAGALAVRAGSAAELAERTERDRRTVLSALGDLRQVGLVVVDGDVYTLDVAAMRAVARAAADVDVPMDPVIGYGMTDEERQVLERFFSGRVLTEIPHNRAKLLIILQRLALEFDVGRRYTEAEVNEILREFHRDWSTLRRNLVDEQFLAREHRDGQTHYWRSGGRVIT